MTRGDGRQPSYTAIERAIIRDAVKEASSRSKAARERRSLPAQAFPDGKDPDRQWAKAVEQDSAEIFVDVLTAALRRSGAWILFLE